jgi:putative ABC transport system substrate-binding protein
MQGQHSCNDRDGLVERPGGHAGLLTDAPEAHRAVNDESRDHRGVVGHRGDGTRASARTVSVELRTLADEPLAQDRWLAEDRCGVEPAHSGGGMTITRAALAVVFALGLFATALSAEVQQVEKVYRIGILANVSGGIWAPFLEGLRDLGYVEGRNIAIEFRSSEGKYERLPDLAAELVRLKVDVIVAAANENVVVAKQATRTIPIVMAGSGDPVRGGLVAALAQPGGNVTGLSLSASELAGKQLQLLKEIVPRVSKVAVLWNPSNRAGLSLLEEAKVAAQSLRVQLQIVEARRPDELQSAFAAMARERAGALLVFSDGMFLLQRTRIADFAAKNRLPAMYGRREFVDAGGLMSYASSLGDNLRRAAAYVDKILKGAKPSDLPVEQASKFDLVFNLKTAKAIGLTIPQSVRLRADHVIE